MDDATDLAGRQARLQTMIENLAAQLDAALARIATLEHQVQALEAVRLLEQRPPGLF